MATFFTIYTVVSFYYSPLISLRLFVLKIINVMELSMEGLYSFFSIVILVFTVTKFDNYIFANNYLLAIIFIISLLLILFFKANPHLITEIIIYYYVVRTIIGICILLVTFLNYTGASTFIYLYLDETLSWCLDHLVFTEKVECQGFIPYKITSNIIKGTESLVKMYTFSQGHNKDLYNYLGQNCMHLMKPPSQDYTTIPTNILEVVHNKIVPLENNFRPSYVLGDEYKSGVYAFIKNDKFINIGSTTEFKTRLGNYYLDYRDFIKTGSTSQLNFFNTVKSGGGFSSMKYAILHSSPNFKMNYLGFPDVQKDSLTLNILTNFSKHEPRIIEQALQAYIQPVCNSDKDVILDYVSWDPNQKYDKYGTLSYTIIGKSVTGELYEYSSMKEARKSLGVDTQEIKRLLNTGKVKYFAGIGNSLSLHNDLLPEKVYDRSWGNYAEITMKEYDLSSIPLNKVRVVNAEDIQITLGEYDNSQRAVAAMDTDHERPRRYINKMYGFKAGPNSEFQGKYYVLRNPDTPPTKSNAIALLKLNTDTGEKELFKVFPSLADVRRHFDLNPSSHNWRSKHVKTGNPYKKIWFMEDATDSGDETE